MSKDSWSGTLAFILASIGSAVGLGNFWRFPYIMGQYGGGSFIIAYLVSVLLVGLPLMLIEIAIGRHFKTSLAGTFDRLSTMHKWIWFIPFVLMLLIMSFYVVISGWTLNYMVGAAMDATIPFSEYSNTYNGVVFYLIVLAVTCVIVVLGVKSGIEMVSKMLVPFLFIIAVALAAFSISLPNADKGLAFYFRFDAGALLSPELWLVAIAQSVFSLSVGYGLMLTYASYVKTKESLLKDSLLITAADTSLALLAGLFIFPAVFSFGYDPAAGTSLAFTTLPSIFAVMPFGNIVGVMFFLLLFIAALTSCIAFIEFIVSNVTYTLGISRKTAVLLTGAAIAILAIPSALSYTPMKLSLFGRPFLDAIDFYFASLGAPLSIFVICSLLWLWKEKEFVGELDGGAKWIGKRLYPWCKYVVPLSGLVLFVLAIKNMLA